MKRYNTIPIVLFLFTMVFCALFAVSYAYDFVHHICLAVQIGGMGPYGLWESILEFFMFLFAATLAVLFGYGSYRLWREDSDSMRKALAIERKFEIRQVSLAERPAGMPWTEDDELVYGADRMTIAEFANAVRDGGFTDEDGIGYYATDKEESTVVVSLVDVMNGRTPEQYTHVIWYNK